MVLTGNSIIILKKHWQSTDLHPNRSFPPVGYIQVITIHDYITQFTSKPLGFDLCKVQNPSGIWNVTKM